MSKREKALDMARDYHLADAAGKVRIANEISSDHGLGKHLQFKNNAFHVRSEKEVGPSVMTGSVHRSPGEFNTGKQAEHPPVYEHKRNGHGQD